ncbi:MAG: acyl-CoA synthetase [Acidimicrobiales bacterium]
MEFNLAQVHEAVASANPDRECIVWRDRRLTYRVVTERSRRLANVLIEHGLGLRTPRSSLSGHESGQDHLGLYLYNGNEYLEGMLGAFKARVAPFNVNYRYVEEELRYLLTDAAVRGIVYHSAFAPTLDKVRAHLPDLALILQVADCSGHGLLVGALDYEQGLAGASAERPDLDWSPDDLYILYTGGTTGMPKGVLWRQHDIFVSAMGGRPFGQSQEFESLEALADASTSGGSKMMATPPLMHGAAQWSNFTAFTGGHTVVMQDDSTRLDPGDVWNVVEREGVLVMQIVGDAFGRPLVEELEQGTHDVSSLFMLVNGGAPLNSTLKERLLAQLPDAFILDAVGSSETGAQMGHTSTKGTATTGDFTPGPGTVVISEDLSEVLAPGHASIGWLAQEGYVPLGYLGDEAKTARTFPVIDGVRYSVPGDRAVLRDDGVIELLGRDAVTINSGGEKIFAEEVEQAIAHHPAVYDVVVCGRPSERWGQEVVALVQLKEGVAATEEELREACGGHVARYKLPKAIVFLDHLQRSPAGKADYRWARNQAVAALDDG